MSCNSNGKLELGIIQGDSCQQNVAVKNVDPEEIEGVYFSSERFNISQKLTYNNETEKYEFYLSPAETANMPVGYGDFDVTIKFKDKNVKTVSYRAYIEVKEKNNKVDYDDEQQ